MLSENLTQWRGRKVVDYEMGTPLGDPEQIAYRLRIDWDTEHSVLDMVADLVTSDGADQIEVLVIGAFAGDDSSGDSGDIVEALAAAKGKLTSLRHLFLGDIIGEENEMSWIVQSDMSPLLNAYPQLETLVTRGTEGLTFGRPQHDGLKALHVQAGGLPPAIIHEIADAQLPNLQDLEVWTGTPDYGGDATPEDIDALLQPGRFPTLKRLGIKNAERADDFAALVAASPIMHQIDFLDLGLGALGDDGAKALLAGGQLGKLKKLSIDHHYVSEELVEQLRAAVPLLSADDRQEPDEWGGEEHRYIAVSE